MCSFDTKLFTKQDISPKQLKPLTFYELRDADTIFIGDHEIVFRNEPDENEKASFYVPETQEIQQDMQMQDTMIPNTEDVEIPETQAVSPEMEIDTDMLTSFIEPETAKCLKKATEKIRKEFLAETQPLKNVLPPCTRRYAAKQNEIKPKTVPLSVFDFDTQALNVETQAMTYTQLMNEKNLKKSLSRKHKSDPPKVINSVLLSDTESDSDDDRSRISAVSVKYVGSIHSENDNSLSKFSMTDDSLMGGIQSPQFDSQFLAQVNSSCNIENSSQVINFEMPDVKKEVKKESNSILTKQESDDDIKPAPPKRIKLFKFVSSDEED